jgi:hypothetical protein
VGAETTGLRAVENLKKSRYVLSNYQHPGEDISDKNIKAVNKEKLTNAMKESIGIQETRGIRYISGLPSKDSAPYKKH